MGWNVPNLMTADEVVEKLKARNKRTIDNLRRSGKLRGILVGREYRYHPDDVQAFQNGKEVGQ